MSQFTESNNTSNQNSNEISSNDSCTNTYSNANLFVVGAYATAALCTLAGTTFACRAWFLNSKPTNQKKSNRKSGKKINSPANKSLASNPQSSKHISKPNSSEANPKDYSAPVMTLSPKNLKKLLKTLPSEQELQKSLSLSEKIMQTGNLYASEIQELHQLVLLMSDIGGSIIAANNKKSKHLASYTFPYAMPMFMDCVEWLLTYNALMTELLISTHRNLSNDATTSEQSLNSMSETIEALKGEHKKNLNKMLPVLKNFDVLANLNGNLNNGNTSSKNKDIIRNSLLRLSISSSCKDYFEIECAYDDVLSVPGIEIEASTLNEKSSKITEKIDEKDEKIKQLNSSKHVSVDMMNLSQLINAFLTSPLIGKQTDFKSFGDKLIEISQTNAVGYSAIQIQNVFQRSPSTYITYRNIPTILSRISENLIKPELLFDGVFDVLNIRKRLISYDTNQKDLDESQRSKLNVQENLSLHSDKNAELQIKQNGLDKKESDSSNKSDYSNPALIVEGATCHFFALPGFENSLFSGSFTEQKIVCCSIEKSVDLQQIIELDRKTNDLNESLQNHKSSQSGRIIYNTLIPPTENDKTPIKNTHKILNYVSEFELEILPKTKANSKDKPFSFA